MEGHIMGSRSLTPASEDIGACQSLIFDPDLLRSICGDNPEVINRLLGRFQQVLDRDLQELDVAILRRSLADIRHQAHRILGSALSIGAQELACAVRPIGAAARAKDWQALGREMLELRAAVARLKPLLPIG